jgi:hypothetical protein
MPRRRSAWHGELASMNLDFDCVETRRRKATGAGRAAVSFGPAMASSIPCEKIKEGRSGE